MIVAHRKFYCTIITTIIKIIMIIIMTIISYKSNINSIMPIFEKSRVKVILMSPGNHNNLSKKLMQV